MEKWQENLILGHPPIKHPLDVTTVTAEGDTTALAQAEAVAEHTRELLTTRGWCLWKCSSLGRDTIVVVRNESVIGYPEGYPVYTEAELEELCQDGVSEATIRLVHEAKKHGGHVINSERKVIPLRTTRSDKTGERNGGTRLRGSASNSWEV